MPARNWAELPETEIYSCMLSGEEAIFRQVHLLCFRKPLKSGACCPGNSASFIKRQAVKTQGSMKELRHTGCRGIYATSSSLACFSTERAIFADLLGLAVTCAAVDVLPDALELGSVVEVGGADGLAHEVPVRAGRLHCHLLLGHDVQQLLPHLLCLPQHCSTSEPFRFTMPKSDSISEDLPSSALQQSEPLRFSIPKSTVILRWGGLPRL